MLLSKREYSEAGGKEGMSFCGQLDFKRQLYVIAVSPSGNKCLVSGRDILQIVNITPGESPLSTGESLYGLQAKQGHYLTDVKWSRHRSEIVASGGSNGTVTIWNLEKQRNLRREKTFSSSVRAVNSIDWDPGEANTLGSGSQAGGISIWDTRLKQRPCASFSQPSPVSVRCIRFPPSAASKSIVGAYEDGSVLLWDLRRPSAPAARFSSHTQSVLSLDWNEDGTVLATGGLDGRISLWNVEDTSQPIYDLHTAEPAWSTAFRPDHGLQLMAVPLRAQKITIWDALRPGIPERVLSMHDDVIAHAMWVPQHRGELVVSCDKGGCVYLHSVPGAHRPRVTAACHPIAWNVAGEIISAVGIVDRAPAMDQSRSFIQRVVREREGSTSAGEDSSGTFLPSRTSSKSRVGHVGKGEGELSVGKGRENSRSPKEERARSDLERLERAKAAAGEMRLRQWDQGGSQFKQLAQYYTLEGSGMEMIEHNHRVAVAVGAPQAQMWQQLKALHPEEVDLGGAGLACEPTHYGHFITRRGSKKALVSFHEEGSEEEDIFLPETHADPLASQMYPMVRSHSIGQRGHSLLQLSEFGASLPLFPAPGMPETMGFGEEHAGLGEVDMGPTLMALLEVSIPRVLNELFRWLAEEGDVLHCLMVSHAVREFWEVPEEIILMWTASSLELMQRHRLFSEATVVRERSTVASIRKANTYLTFRHVSHGKCGTPLPLQSNGECHKCGEVAAKCVLCHRNVTGLYSWCELCGHGGHLRCLRIWFSENSRCPAGCGHTCRRIPRETNQRSHFG